MDRWEERAALSEPPIVIDEAFLAQLRLLSNESLVHETLGDLEVDVLDILEGRHTCPAWAHGRRLQS